MYRATDLLDPVRYGALAEAVLAEMPAADYTAVGEFRYVHHRRDGSPYDDPNAVGLALADAAERAG